MQKYTLQTILRTIGYTKKFPAFSLIEMIVVFSLVILMSGVVLFDYRTSKNNNTVNDAAYNILGILRSTAQGGRSISQIDINTDTNKLAPAMGVLFGLDSGTGDIDTISIYKSGYGSGTGYSYDDSVLEQFTVRSNKVKIFLCTNTEYTDHTCTPYITPVGNPMPYIEFGRLSSEPVIEGGYDQNISSAKSPTIMVQGIEDTTQAKFIIIERTGNIFIR
jgi:type II secretory pathway pseudopilin PulG